MQSILVASDGSEGADRALDVAAELAKALGGNLSSLTVGGNLSADEIRPLFLAEKDLSDASIRSRSKSSNAAPNERSASAYRWPTHTSLGAIRRQRSSIQFVANRSTGWWPEGGAGASCGLALGQRLAEGRDARCLHCDRCSVSLAPQPKWPLGFDAGQSHRVRSRTKLSILVSGSAIDADCPDRTSL